MSLAQTSGRFKAIPADESTECVESLLREIAELQDARSQIVLKIDELADMRSVIDSKIASSVAILVAHGAKASITIESEGGEVFSLESSLPKPKDFATIAANYIRDKDRPLFDREDTNGHAS